MKITAKELSYIKALKKLEPTFIKAGRLALKMQKEAKSHHKLATGEREIDIVTEADHEVQKFVLQEMIKTSLTECRLFAEEKTDLAKKFNPEGKYFLTLDPIHGTARYADGLAVFSLLVGFHNGKAPLYNFIYYPALEWLITINGLDVKISGSFINVQAPPREEKVILYIEGEPKRDVPKLYQRLINNNYVFCRRKELAPIRSGMVDLFISGQVSGLYKGKVVVYDGLPALHYALAKGYKIYTGGPRRSLDISVVEKSDSHTFHPGWYLALAK